MNDSSMYYPLSLLCNLLVKFINFVGEDLFIGILVSITVIFFISFYKFLNKD